MKTPIQKLIETIEEINARGICLTSKGMITVLTNTKEEEQKALLEAYSQGYSDLISKYSKEEQNSMKTPLCEDFCKIVEKKLNVKITDTTRKQLISVENRRRDAKKKIQDPMKEAEKFFRLKYK